MRNVELTAVEYSGYDGESFIKVGFLLLHSGYVGGGRARQHSHSVAADYVMGVPVSERFTDTVWGNTEKSSLGLKDMSGGHLSAPTNKITAANFLLVFLLILTGHRYRLPSMGSQSRSRPW